MAKSKGKSKNKTSKQPLRVVVVNPWSSNKEDVSAWFALMLRDEYPDVNGVNVVFHRKSNGSKIVELPKEVKDISMCLGTHYFSAFLRNKPNSVDFSIIYEYKTAYANDPGEKNWSEDYPANRSIPSNFPVIYPYPPPLPVRPLSEYYMDQEYASNPSPMNLERIERRRIENMAKINQEVHGNDNATSNNTAGPSCSDSFGESLVSTLLPGKSSASSSSTKPNVQTSGAISEPEHNINFIKKMDPYEEAEVAQELLRSLSPVKKTETNHFLDSITKQEEKPRTSGFEDRQHGSESDDIHHTEAAVKPESTDIDIPDEEDYKPSAELLAMLATFDNLNEQEVSNVIEEAPGPPNLDPSVVDLRFSPECTVKQEPTEEEMHDLDCSSSCLFGLNEDLMTSDVSSHGRKFDQHAMSAEDVSRKSETKPRIKLEYEDDSIPFLPPNTAQRNNSTAVSGHPIFVIPQNKRLDGDRPLDREYPPSKRVKTEEKEVRLH